eukprot:5051394-Alexandrium_andersonii.AAC.1
MHKHQNKNDQERSPPTGDCECPLHMSTYDRVPLSAITATHCEQMYNPSKATDCVQCRAL